MNWTQSTSTKSTIISSVRNAIKKSDLFKIKSLYLSNRSNTCFMISTYDGSSNTYDLSSSTLSSIYAVEYPILVVFTDVLDRALNSFSTSSSVLAFLACVSNYS